jgi:D-glycero-D-manno-heptose 1,7-bisphosphate phosphatase
VTTTLKKAVFLDRDGVINSYVYNPEFGTVDSPSNPDEFQIVAGVPEAMAAFRHMGFLVVVVSNQPGIAKGKFSAELLHAVTAKMTADCSGAINAVYYCLHHPQATHPEYLLNCACRKPKPGLLLKAAEEMNIDLRESVMIGDGLTDVIAGQRAGSRAILLSQRKCYVCDQLAERGVTPDFIATTLADAVPIMGAINSDAMLRIKGAYKDELLARVHRGSHCSPA